MDYFSSAKSKKASITIDYPISPLYYINSRQSNANSAITI